MKGQISPEFKRAAEVEVRRMMEAGPFNKRKIVADAISAQSKLGRVNTLGKINHFFVAQTAKDQGASNAAALALGKEIKNDVGKWKGIADQVARNRSAGKDSTQLQKQARDIEKKWGFNPR